MNSGFRAALKEELSVWVKDEILNAETAKRLSEKYQLDNLKTESSRLLSAVIFTLGSLLLGGGVITFVAANWRGISVPLKLGFLFSALLGFHLFGFFLWYIKGWDRLGHALIFCGCLIFGANIGLIAQIFHIRNDWYAGVGYWAIGVLLMAWAIRSWITGLLFLLTSFVWFAYFYNDGNEQLSTFYPFALAALLLPLTFITRSRALYVLTLLGIIASGSVIGGFGVNAKATLIIITSGGLFAWTLSEVHKVSTYTREFAKASSAVGLSILSIAAYIWSFNGLWSTQSEGKFSLMSVLFLLLSIIGLVFVLRNKNHERTWLFVAVILVAFLLCGAAFLTKIKSIDDSLPTTISNIAALVLGSAIIGIGVVEERRASFWLGSLYIILLILSRFLEYETSLMLKSAVFLVCGIAVIVAGVFYEMYLRRKDVPIEIKNAEETI